MTEKNWVIILLAVLLSSCTSASIGLLQYDQLSPASVSLPNDIKKVAVIDRLDMDIKDGLHGITLNSKEFASLVGTHLADADYFDDVVLCDSNVAYIDHNDSIIMPLSQSNVQQLTNDLDVNLLVAVEYVSASLINIVYMPMVAVKALAKVYVPSRQNALCNLAVSDTLTWVGDGGEVTYGTISHDVMAYAAEKITHQLAPYWEPVERTYFTGGNANFRDADMFLKRGDWDMASQLWSETLNSAKGTLRLQTLYNLVLAKEMQGDIEDAVQDCTQLVEQCKGNAEMLRMATAYLSLLKKRSVDQQMLNLQMLRFGTE